MSWRDRLGNRRGDDEDYDTVEAELKRAARGPSLVYCSKCQLPIDAKWKITKHKVCPETTSNQDGR